MRTECVLKKWQKLRTVLFWSGKHSARAQFNRQNVTSSDKGYWQVYGTCKLRQIPEDGNWLETMFFVNILTNHSTLWCHCLKLKSLYLRASASKLCGKIACFKPIQKMAPCYNVSAICAVITRFHSKVVEWAPR